MAATPGYQLPDLSRSNCPAALKCQEKANLLIEEGRALGQIPLPASGPYPSRPEGLVPVKEQEPERLSKRQ